MNLDDLRRLRDKAKRELAMRSEHQRFRVVVGMGTSGLAKGSREVLNAILEEIEKKKVDDIEVVTSGSAGIEDLQPVVTVEERGQSPVIYGEITPDLARRIVAEHILGGKKITSHVVARQLPEEVG